MLRRLVAALFCVQWSTTAFTTPLYGVKRPLSLTIHMAGGEGGESEWLKALMDASGKDVGSFEEELKMKGLMKPSKTSNPKLNANSALVKWLEEEGEVYLSEKSTWGEAPHPMAISIETRDEITNESSGRGLLARRDINDGDELLKIPLKLCLTKKSARKVIGKDVLPSTINEYLAIACQLIYERYVMGDKSFYKAYIEILPETQEVNPTFTWSDEDLAYLEGSPVVAATQSLQMKIRREYEELIAGENGISTKFPDRFPPEVRARVCWIVSSFEDSQRHNARPLRLKTGSGLSSCFFLGQFASEILSKARRWPWCHTPT